MKQLFVALMMMAMVAHAETREPQFSVTYNAFETAAFITANKLIVAKTEPDLIYLPFHFDGQMRVRDGLGVSFGLVYRFESYQDKGPLYSENNKLRHKKIWTNYHELFLLAGPRFSFQDTGLWGWYFAMKGGVGTAVSPEYFSLSFLAQPEIGYAFSFGEPGFRLELGLGVMANMPFFETKEFAVPWKANRLGYSVTGVLVHQATPIVNVGVGINW